MKREMKCVLCGHDSYEIIGEKQFENIRTKNESFAFTVRLVCCKKCGIVFQNPLQDLRKLEAYYTTMYREEGCRPPQAVEKEFNLRAEFACKFVKKGQRVMEIGCADGTTLGIFRNRGMIPYGIEVSKSNVSLCRGKNIEVFSGLYEKYPLSKERELVFDLVCNYFVLEHVVSPVKFLSFCNRLVNVGGTVCIEVPDIGAYENEESPSDLLFIYEHQFHFTQETIDILLRRCGFKLLEFANSSQPFGMHFAARKVSCPLSSHRTLDFPSNVSDVVMKKIKRAEESFVKRETMLREKLSLLIKRRKLDKKTVVIFGADNHTKILLRLPEFKNISVKFIVDNNKDKQGILCCNIPVCSPNTIDCSMDTVIISSRSFESEIFEQLLGMGIEPQRIVRLYS